MHVDYGSNETGLHVVIAAGFFPAISDLIKKGDCQTSNKILQEAVRFITSLSLGEDESLIASDTELLHALITIIRNSNEDEWGFHLKCDIIPVFGNLANISVEYCDKLLNEFHIYQLLHSELERLESHLPTILQHDHNESRFSFYTLAYLRNLIWTLQSVCKSRPSPQHYFQPGDRLLELLFLYYQSIDDIEIIRDISYCFFFAFIASGDMDKIPFLQKLINRIEKIFIDFPAANHSSADLVVMFYPILKLLVLIASSDSSHSDLVATNETIFSLVLDLLRKTSNPSLQAEVLVFFGYGLFRSPLMVIATGVHAIAIELFFTTSKEVVRRKALWLLGVLIADEESSMLLDLQMVKLHTLTDDVRDRVIPMILKLVACLRQEGCFSIANKCVNTLYCLERRVRVFSREN